MIAISIHSSEKLAAQHQDHAHHVVMMMKIQVPVAVDLPMMVQQDVAHYLPMLKSYLKMTMKKILNPFQN
jgi:hypothetical protein